MFQSLKGIIWNCNYTGAISLISAGGFQSLKGIIWNCNLKIPIIKLPYECFNPLKGLFEIAISCHDRSESVTTSTCFNPLKGLFEIAIVITPQLTVAQLQFQSLKGIIWNCNLNFRSGQHVNSCFNPLKGLFEIAMYQRML